jgi:hypothetical protein
MKYISGVYEEMRYTDLPWTEERLLDQTPLRNGKSLRECKDSQDGLMIRLFGAVRTSFWKGKPRPVDEIAPAWNAHAFLADVAGDAALEIPDGWIEGPDQTAVYPNLPSYGMAGTSPEHGPSRRPPWRSSSERGGQASPLRICRTREPKDSSGTRSTPRLGSLGMRITASFPGRVLAGFTPPSGVRG